MYARLLVFLLFVSGSAARHAESAYVPTSFTSERDVIAYIHIGTPAREYTLKVGFDCSEIALELDEQAYRDFETHPRAISNTYTMGIDGRGYDMISLDETTFFLPVRYARKGALDIGENLDGTICFSRLSPVWRFWTSMTLSVGHFLFGGKIGVLHDIRDAHVPLIRCESSSESVCRFLGSVDGKLYYVDFFTSSQNMHVPLALYEKYVIDQPLYGYTDTKLKTIVIDLHPHVQGDVNGSSFLTEVTAGLEGDSTCVHDYRDFGFSSVETCREDFSLEIEPHMYVTSLIGDDDTMTNTLELGTRTIYSPDVQQEVGVIEVPVHLLGSMIVYVERAGNHTVMAIKPHHIMLSPRAFEIVLVVLIFINYIIYQRRGAERGADNGFVVMIEIIGLGLGFLASFPFHRSEEILRDFPVIHAWLFPLITLVTVTGIYAVARDYAGMSEFSRPSEAIAFHGVRRFSYEYVVLSGFWMLWIHLRTSTLGIIPTVGITLWLTYVTFMITSYTVVALLTVGTERDVGDDVAWTAGVPIAMFILCGWIVSFTYIFNVQPYIQSLLRIYTTSVNSIAVAVVVVTALVGIFKGVSLERVARLLVTFPAKKEEGKSA